MSEAFGTRLRRWRLQRRFTQMDLAAEAEVSTRHLSCLETGKAAPSRSMALTLAEVLDLPFGETNLLLSSAGFAPVFRDRGLDGPDAEPVRAAVAFLLRRHHPYPAVVVDAGWNARCANDAYVRFSRRLAAPDDVLDLDPDPERLHIEPFANAPNVLLPFFDEAQLKPLVQNFEAFSTQICHHLQRAARDEPAALETLHKLESLLPPPPAEAREPTTDPRVVIPLELSVRGEALQLFTMMSMFASSADTVLSSLRIETLFPADAQTERRLLALATGRACTP